MMNRFETYFDANYTYHSTQNSRILKSFGLFENLAFVIMSTREIYALSLEFLSASYPCWVFGKSFYIPVGYLDET